jgi:uncharacterized protein (DUF885 family)
MMARQLSDGNNSAERSGYAHPVTNAPDRRWTPVDRLAEEYLDASAALDPVAATFSGLLGHDDRLTDYSPGGHAARAQLARDTLARLGGLTAADEVDQVTVAALTERLQHTADLHAAGLDLAELNNIACPVQIVREVFDVTPSSTPDDWARIGQRLHAVPDALHGYRQSLLHARAGGWVPAARQVLVAAAQADEFGAPGGFFAQLVAGQRPAGLDDGARRAARAYAELGDWLRATLLPGARANDAVGPDVYAISARGFLGTSIDPEDTYAWALGELARIESRMAEVSRRLAPDAAAAGATGPRLVDAAVAALEADPRRILHGTSALREWMQELSDAAIVALAGTHFDIPAPLRRLECRIAPSTAGGIYYTGPSEDFSRPGRMWWSVPAGVTSFSTWQETTTVYHEGVPGHHLQIGQAVARAGQLNRWRRMGCWISGHGEGWALYAERLMEELGFLTDPGDLLGMLDGQALRASRVIVDLGVHLRMPAPAEIGGGTWDAAKAWVFLSAHTRLPEALRRFELDRYLGWPGQALAYKVGERVWLRLREEATARGMDLRAFHARALDLGAVGLDVLTGALAAAS